MARKLGDFGFGLAVLFFCISGLSFLFAGIDLDEGVDSDIEFTELESDLEDVNTMVVVMSAAVDNATDLTPTDPAGQGILLEKRASEYGGITNLFNKNIVISFFSSVSKEFAIPTPVIQFVNLIIAVVVITLFVRFFFGEGKA